MKQSVVRARIDNDLKAEASAVLESCGLGLSDAVRIFLRQVVKQGGLPFPVRARHVVSGNQLRKMKSASPQRDRKLAANAEAEKVGSLRVADDFLHGRAGTAKPKDMLKYLRHAPKVAPNSKRGSD